MTVCETACRFLAGLRHVQYLAVFPMKRASNQGLFAGKFSAPSPTLIIFLADPYLAKKSGLRVRVYPYDQVRKDIESLVFLVKSAFFQIAMHTCTLNLELLDLRSIRRGVRSSPWFWAARRSNWSHTSRLTPLCHQSSWIM